MVAYDLELVKIFTKSDLSQDDMNLLNGYLSSGTNFDNYLTISPVESPLDEFFHKRITENLGSKRYSLSYDQIFDEAKLNQSLFYLTPFQLAILRKNVPLMEWLINQARVNPDQSIICDNYVFKDPDKENPTYSIDSPQGYYIDPAHLIENFDILMQNRVKRFSSFYEQAKKFRVAPIAEPEASPKADKSPDTDKENTQNGPHAYKENIQNGPQVYSNVSGERTKIDRGSFDKPSKQNNASNQGLKLRPNFNSSKEYEILGLTYEQSKNKKLVAYAYRKLSIHYHPDRKQTGNRDKFEKLESAYTKLK